MVSTKEPRIGGINTSALDARNKADRIYELRQYRLGMLAIGGDTIPEPILSGNRLLATATLAHEAALLHARHPGVVDVATIPTSPLDVGAEAAHSIGRILRAPILQSGL
jgi:hypothetical protein